MLTFGIIIFILGAVADAYMTKRATLDKPLPLREGNKVVGWFLKWEEEGLWGTKVLGASLLWLATAPWYLWLATGVIQLYLGYRNRKLILKVRENEWSF